MCAWGEALGAALRPGDVVALRGDLGAGKTTLVRAMAHGYGVREEVTSPTYALLHRYDSPRGVVHHADLYRLSGPAELAQLGWDDLFDGTAVVVVEWPERAGSLLPMPTVEVLLASVPGDGTRRRITVT